MSTAFKMTLVTLALVGVAIAYFTIKKKTQMGEKTSICMELESYILYLDDLIHHLYSLLSLNIVLLNEL